MLLQVAKHKMVLLGRNRSMYGVDTTSDEKCSRTPPVLLKSLLFLHVFDDARKDDLAS